ncbi:hypothetical protein ABZY57_12905, partial [Streptomyces sp. NPDC006450]|uniref:hypothetical protein n=1 Tax=Streptomyces sp. NPDC006450 TaxID=3155458 RepID=UPI0033B0CF22
GTSSTEMDGVSTFGVDFWHAVEFSRNGRFLCTHPLGLSSGLSFSRFRLYQSQSRLFSAFQFFAFAFPFPASPTLSEDFHRISRLQFPE